jgi:tetratricopeptide (TPR) repeat protein
MIIRQTWTRCASLLTTLLLVGLAVAQTTRATQPNVGETPEAHLGKGYDALKQDRYDVAVNEFRAALALDPKLTLRARFPLTVALFEMHKFDDARRELETVRREVGDHPNIWYYLGRLDIEGHNFEGAIHNFNQAISKPPFPDTAYYLGFAYLKQGDLANAEKWLKEASQSTPRDARVQYQLGLVYREQGLEEQAKEAFALSDQLRQKDNEESRLKVECGQKLDQGRGEEAHAICEQLYDPGDPEKLTALGTIYGQHGDLEAALKPLRRAAELAPQSPQMQYNLALTYYRLNRFEEASAPLSSALKRWPDLFQLNALNGAVLLKLGKDLPAYEALRHAHQLNPQDSGTGDLLYAATLALARKSQEDQQYSDSLRYFEEAGNLRPKEPAPHQGMAKIYHLTNHPEQASTEEQKAKRLSKNLGRVQ